MPSPAVYDLKSVKLPRFAGGAFRLVVNLAENPATAGFLIPRLLRDGGITALRDMQFDEPPTFHPPLSGDAPAGEPPPPAELIETIRKPRPAQTGFAFKTIYDYARAYRDGAANPEAVAQSALDAIAASDAGSVPLRAFIAVNREDVLAQARASAQRHRDSKPISVLDGVPVAVKDEVDMLPYPTTVGTKFLGKAPAREDSTVAARMRAAGALLLGKANMHEIGIGVTGLNPHHGTTRNPYRPGHHTGGSSSGPATAVAAGLCPTAIGADGGGSIRLPSAFCGVVGLKPTYGRVSEFGAASLTWSLGHLGPIAATAWDAAVTYAFLAGPDPRDPNTLGQPAVTLQGFDDLDLSGLKLGVFWPWFNHATPAMAGECQKLLTAFEKMGARIVEVEIPNLEAARVAHLITITSEMAAALDRYHAAHRADYALETRIDLTLARAFTSRDYVQAQRVRTRMIAGLERAFEQADIVVTPAAGVTAPRIPPDALPDGESDISILTEIMRFAFLANLTGHPAISFPAGHDAHGLPVGFQAIGRRWEEHVLLRLAHAAEQVVERKKPQIHFDVLTDGRQ